MLSRTASLGRRGATTTGVVSVVALVVAVLALFLAVFRDPFGPVYRMNWHVGPPMAGYDFSTPSAALRSRLKIEAARDVRAMMEYSRLLEMKELNEKLDTLEIKKEVDVNLPKKRRGLPPLPVDPVSKDDRKAADQKPEKVREIKLLFVTYKEDGDPQYKVEAFERYPSGLWKQTYVSEYDVKDVDANLAKQMERWEATGKE
jgi:hypothetical protein